MKSVPNLALEQIYPPICGGINLNTCQDPDCGNFGVAADFGLARPKGRNARARLASSGSNSAMIGPGKYKLATTKGPAHRRISTVFEYQGDPHSWLDRKNLECQFHRTAGPCGSHFEILSNEQLLVDRLRSANGAFVGPRCRACGRDYLAAPDEFILDGAEITPPREDNDAEGRKSGHRTRSSDSAATPDRVRLIHKPRRGQSGARISATLDHRRHRRSADNVAILLAL